MNSRNGKKLVVGGFVPLTTTDLPGALSAVVFCQGCPWACRYCHNTHLITPSPQPDAPNWDELLEFLRRRRGLLDAVVFSGGEPTMQSALVGAVEQVASLGFAIGLHTAGQYPRTLAQVLPYLSWIGMDLKAPMHNYDSLVKRKVQPSKILASIEMIVSSGVNYEFRTTVHPTLHGGEDIVEISQLLKSFGVKKYVLQKFRAQGCGDNDLCCSADTSPVTRDLVATLESSFEEVELR
ncbi:MAG: anaerobic ribonucleoside-triphosphate reductase activating protein [Proteobacteria bacterium]|nr:MAG: anaerobic ribonucleoside-triphosphate reductase activating protein [Pseudomonadota bacterium]